MYTGLIHLPWWGYVVLTLIATHITCVAVTVFLHRNQAHQSLELHPIVSHFFRLWLWMTTGMVTKEWTAVHRKHHSVVETEDDPHSPQIHGLLKVLFGGVGLYRQETERPETIRTFGRGTPDDWMERNVYEAHHTAGIISMAIIDVLLFGFFPGALIWLIQMLWIPFWAAGVINGIGHFWGYRNFETKDASTNIVPWGIMIAGEELHNNHHAYASSARLSNKWYELDVGWMYIKLFEFLGLATVKRIAPKVCFDFSKEVCDVETLKAVVLHRLHVMANFKKALKKVYSEEIDRLKQTVSGSDVNDIQALKGIKRDLLSDPAVIETETAGKIDEVLSKHAVLNQLYQMKKSLVSFWDSAAGSQEQLVEKLNEWCSQAEQSGIESLRSFSRKLKSYSLATS